MKFTLCSDCFSNIGLKAEAERVGIRTSARCPQCGSKLGRKLGDRQLEKLIARFFIKGTTPHGVGGYASILQYNPMRQKDEVDLDERTARDWALIKGKIGAGLFFYAPHLWQIGVTEHYDDANVISDDTISKITKNISVKNLPAGFKTFRIRKNLESEKALDILQYDAPPSDLKREFGRFDDATNSILYTSPSLPVCLHECRTIITDDVFVATLETTTGLRLADLTADYKNEPESPFEHLRYFFNGIFLTRDPAIYEIARRVAHSIKKTLSVDGFITDSFFTTVSQEPVSQNYCFFSEAMKSGKLSLHSLNRVHLETVAYTYVFGPVFSSTIPKVE